MSRRKPIVPDRRTTIVLGSLLGAMTAMSILLLVLEPGPIAPLSVLKLSSMDREVSPETVLFNTEPQARYGRWSAIVVRMSGQMRGSAAMLNEQHAAQGLGGLAHHFVIGNGNGAADGQIEIGYRWRNQIDSAAAAGEHADWFNRNSISICLIGDGQRQAPTDAQIRELVWLVQRLQVRLGISPERVLVEAGPQVTGQPPRLFPVARFRQQLLTPATP